MIIIFKTEDQILEYLIEEKSIAWYGDYFMDFEIKFMGIEFKSGNDFLIYLKSFGLINELYEYIQLPNRQLNLGDPQFELRITGFAFKLTEFTHLKANKMKTSNGINEGLISINKACEILDVARPTLYGWLREGELPHYEIGGKKKISKEDLDSFIRSKKRITYGDKKDS